MVPTVNKSYEAIQPVTKRHYISEYRITKAARWDFCKKQRGIW